MYPYYNLFLIFLFILAPKHLYGKVYSFSSPPSWIKPRTVDKVQSKMGSDGKPETYLYYERNLYYSDDMNVNSYSHLVVRAENSKGVEDHNVIEIELDPSHQRIVIHDVSVLKKSGKIIRFNEKDLKTKVIQKETSSHKRIYTGVKQVILFIPKLSVGDTVSYSYSRIGSNPLYKGHAFSNFSVEFQFPVDEVSYTLSLPKNIKLYEKSIATKKKFKKKVKGNRQIWSLVMKKTKGQNFPIAHPKGKPFYGSVQVSTFKDWDQVSRTDKRFYTVDKKLSPRMRTILAKIKKKGKSPSQKYLEALKYVEKEIRYLGLEWGDMSHKPTPPDKVLQDLYGDCKAKVFLLHTLLTHLGIESYPAYVNSNKNHVYSIPSPDAFNHVILQVKIDGKIFWADPTRDFQSYTSPSDIYINGFGYALLIGKKNAWQKMNLDYLGQSGYDLRLKVDASNPEKDSRFSFRIKMNGYLADYVRYHFNNSERKGLQFLSQKFSNKFVGEEDVEDFKVRECKKKNCLYLSFAFTKKIWKKTEQGSRNILQTPINLIYFNFPQLPDAGKMKDHKWISFNRGLKVSSKVEIKFASKPSIEWPEFHRKEKAYSMTLSSEVKRNTFIAKHSFASFSPYLSLKDARKYKEDLEDFMRYTFLTYQEQNKLLESPSESLLDEFLD